MSNHAHAHPSGLAVVERDPVVVDVMAMYPNLARMLEWDLSGADQGTNERGDVIYQTLDGADLNAMWREFQEVLAIRNGQRDRLVNYLTYQVENAIEQVRYPLSENFEEATEYGEPKGIRLGPAYNMGFGFRWWDLAIRYSWQFLMESTQAQVEALHNEALEADDRLVFNRVFRACFNSLNEASSIRNIPVTVYKFWNGDGIAPPYYKNFVFDGTHNHYITSGAAAINSAAVQSIETHLYHHGYSRVNGYSLVLFVNRQEGTVLRTARVTAGWQYDFIPGPAFGGQIIMPASMGVAGGAPIAPDLGPLASQAIGFYGPFTVVEEDYMPAGYVLSLVSKGAENLGNPIGIRVHQNPAGQGLRLIGGDDAYPLMDSFYRHGFGTGIRHRGAGVLMQITTNASYTIPAAYV